MDSSTLNYQNATVASGIASAIAILLCFFLFRFIIKFGHHSREPPTVSGAWPIIGHLPLLRGSKQLHITLASMADKYGPLFTIKSGSKKTIVLSNWEMAKECFTTNDMAVSTRPTKLVANENLSYNGAMFGFAPYGPYWRQIRKIVTLELLSNRRIEQLSHIRVSEVQASVKDVYRKRNNDEEYVLVEMKQWFAELIFNMVFRMLVGKRCFGFGGLENNNRCLETIREFMNLLGVFTVGDVVPLLRWLDFGGYEKAMKKTAKELDEVLDDFVREHRQKRSLLDEKDFLDVMISVFDDASGVDGFDAHTIIKATTLTMITGATDTTTVTLTWAMCMLLRNPHTLKKAKEELNTQIGKERRILESDLSKLQYLQAIIKETLRLYPPSPLGVHREFTENCNLGGYQIKKGTRLITNIWKIHTDSSIWSDPLEFKPERFLTTHKDVDVKGHHFELLPFGSGRRACPAISFGFQMVHFILASFLHSFEILNPSPELVDIDGTLGITHVKTTPLEILVKPCLIPNCYETM
ncbi:cytochrome P450 82A1-like [Arachis ipaensis]|uniref:Cytochrome P450 n=1 Tax=Arachis hypogaea TaxID=3818 RepID=A0A444Z301_ARAHY|nr:cytochrome P450 82A1-like [Arachis ipaensis]XP_025655290.1 cytochrome P450 82A1 [Arachis hypogaea]QHO12650.1 Cytochrome P450 [Arachis hypogaea]RYR08434.1 hypothetical protein Ahy_B05g076115 [Arachis hypogaea]